MNLKKKLPWWTKFVLKVFLSRIPLSYTFWKRLALFEHGAMDKPEYAYRVFKGHFDKVLFPRKSGNFVAMEIGPGDSLFSAVIAHAFGASSTYLIDDGSFVSNNIAPYLGMIGYLKKMGLSTFTTHSNPSSLCSLLHLCNAVHMTSGIASLRTIPDQSVDFIWSQAVLEHIRRSDFSSMMIELRRILRDDGICSHTIDLRDHLGGSLNHLRFPARLWESDFIAKSGFYTNRLRYSEMLELFKLAGFDPLVTKVKYWDRIPIARAKISRQFKNLTDNELSVSVFDVVLRPV